MKRGDSKLRFFYLVWALFEVLCFSGLLYGWSSLVFVLKAEGLFLNLCNVTVNSTTGESDPLNAKLSISCPERDERFSLVFSVDSALFNIGIALMGLTFYTFGTRISRLIGFVFFTTGALMIAFISNEAAWMIFPGLILLATGGITYLLTNYQVSRLFPNQSLLICGITNGAIDSSAGIQQFVKLAFEQGVSRKTSYLIIAGANCLTLISTFFFLPKDFIYSENGSNGRKPGSTNPSYIELEDLGSSANTPNSSEKTNIIDKSSDPQKTVELNLRKCILSPIFIMHVVWFCLLELRFYYFINTLNTSLEKLLHNAEDVSSYTSIFSYILMCGVIPSLLAGLLYNISERCFKRSSSKAYRVLMPSVMPQATVTTLCIILSSILLVENSSIFYPSFIAVAFFRSFLYTIASVYINYLYPPQFFGPMVGIMMISSGFLNFLQYVFYKWSRVTSIFQVNVFLLILASLSYVQPGFQMWAARNREGRPDILH